MRYIDVHVKICYHKLRISTHVLRKVQFYNYSERNQNICCQLQTRLFQLLEDQYAI